MLTLLLLLSFSNDISMKNESLREEKVQSASVESIPEVLEECTSVAEHSDSASVHDMDYVNPRGVRFTQSSQKEGERWAMLSCLISTVLFHFLLRG